MREIKFRGKRIDNGKWVCGSLVVGTEKKAHYIFTQDEIEQWEVNPETVGQYTGLQDKNGTPIYEGDVLKTILTKSDSLNNVIVYGHCGFEHKWLDAGTAHLRSSKQDPMFRNVSLIFDVIGNIYENKELIE